MGESRLTNLVGAQCLYHDNRKIFLDASPIIRDQTHRSILPVLDDDVVLVSLVYVVYVKKCTLLTMS